MHSFFHIFLWCYYYISAVHVTAATLGHGECPAFFSAFITHINYWIYAVCLCDWNCILFSSPHLAMKLGERVAIVCSLFYNAIFVAVQRFLFFFFFLFFHSPDQVYSIFGVHWTFWKIKTEKGAEENEKLLEGGRTICHWALSVVTDIVYCTTAPCIYMPNQNGYLKCKFEPSRYYRFPIVIIMIAMYIFATVSRWYTNSKNKNNAWHSKCKQQQTRVKMRENYDEKKDGGWALGLPSLSSKRQSGRW